MTHASVLWDENHALVGTDTGLRLFRFSDGSFGTSPMEWPAEGPYTMGRDGRGRLWMVGPGLWVSDVARRTMSEVGPLPMGSPVHSIARNPDDDCGVVLAMGSRGVVFVVVGVE